jgi:hypothetical protein
MQAATEATTKQMKKFLDSAYGYQSVKIDALC